jgi:hypothetical protein
MFERHAGPRAIVRGVPDRTPSSRELVLGGAALMIAGQLAFRAWALLGSWFYLDDLLILDDARHAHGIGYLFQPYYSHVYSWGRLVSALVDSTPVVDWHLTVVISLLTQAAAGAACVWMLVVLFGARPMILGPLSVYLFSAVTVPASMWWSGNVTAQPLQIAFFTSVAAWVLYLRTERRRWLAVTLLVVAVALTTYIKCMLLIPLLAYIAVAYFAHGNVVQRLVSVVRRYWLAVVCAAAVGGGYLVFYRLTVPQMTSDSVSGVWLSLAGTMLSQTLVTGLVGGPWRWDDRIFPAALADPPAIAVELAWVLLALAIVYCALRRVRTGRAWLLLALYAAGSYAALLTTRAALVGAVAGQEYRYLSDVTCAWALAIGLATMPLLGSTEGSAPRADPVLRIAIGRRAVVAVFAVVAVSGMVSAVSYVHVWHHQNPDRTYFLTAGEELESSGPVDFADAVVPDDVIPGWLNPRNELSRLLPLVTDNARFPDVTDDLHVLDASGHVREAEIQSGLSAPQGPKRDCGWLVRGGPTTIPLGAKTYDLELWVRIGYLSSAAGTVEVTAGDTTREAPVRRGLGTAYVRFVGVFDSVVVRPTDPGVTLCVDKVDVGQLLPGCDE